MTRARPAAPSYWFDGSLPPWHMRAVSAIYGAVTATRRWSYRHHLLRSMGVPHPVIVVGNLIAGGSGKTPLTLALIERLQAAGWNPGVASRGYGRVDMTHPLWVTRDTDPMHGGDEPVLIARTAHVKVRVDRDRAAAAKALVEAGCDVIVCDDGLQHYRLSRDIEIEVIDGRRRYGNGRLLPAGPLREPVARGALCDFRVVNAGGMEAIEPQFGEWPMRLLADDARALHGARRCALTKFAGQRVHAIAGIGDPDRFFAMLKTFDIAVVPHAFADHHQYRPEDLQFGSDLPVLLTSKDAVKISAFNSAIASGERWFSVPIRAELPEAFWIALLDRLRHHHA